MEDIYVKEELIIDDSQVTTDSEIGSDTSEYIELCENDEINGDLKKLKSLLHDFQLLELLPVLQAANVTYRCLRYIQAEDLIEAIPHLGLRVEFREKLFAWRTEQLGVDDETFSNPKEVQECLSKHEQDFPSRSTCSFIKSILNKELTTILSRTSKGKACLETYKECQKLSDSNRDDIIHIIVEEFVYNEISLKPNDFIRIFNDICSIFPSEKEAKEYYYIAREGRKNPRGKLYHKYTTQRRKLAKMTRRKLFKTYSSDDTIAISLKPLNIDSSDWEEVCENWKKTYNLRQKDLQRLSNTDFFNNWSKYSDSRAPQLIKIDFNLKYPEKGHLLYSKWDVFKERLQLYFNENVKHNYNQQRFLLSQSAVNKDAQDYIFATLLAGILLPSVRFLDEDGKLTKRLSITAAQESFVLCLTSIDNYEAKIAEFVSKYYSMGTTIPPYLIAEGASDTTVKSFYVYFNKTLFSCSSFLESLDICFKIFHVFSLKYPQTCAESWVFIQKYLFDITTPDDIKSSKIASLLAFMTSQEK